MKYIPALQPEALQSTWFFQTAQYGQPYHCVRVIYQPHLVSPWLELKTYQAELRKREKNTNLD